MGGKFANKLDELAVTDDFKKVVRLTSSQNRDGTREECVLRFFVFLDRYKKFEHSVEEFLNEYMKDASAKFNYAAHEREFRNTFKELSKVFPDGIMRPHRKGKTPLNLFEGISVGAALALREQPALITDGLKSWMSSDKLRNFTTGATNSRNSVAGRIEFCRDRFLGVPYVPDTSN